LPQRAAEVRRAAIVLAEQLPVLARRLHRPFPDEIAVAMC
jgi:hypothetical protein